MESEPFVAWKAQKPPVDFLTFSDISGQTVKLKQNQQLENTNTQVVLATIDIATGTGAIANNIPVLADVSGGFVDISGGSIDISGGIVDISGFLAEETFWCRGDVAGTTMMDISGSLPDISGCMPVISQNYFDISGSLATVASAIDELKTWKEDSLIVSPRITHFVRIVIPAAGSGGMVLSGPGDLSGAAGDLSGSAGDLSGSTGDLSGGDLSGADLSGADLSGADLSGADLSGADLSGADLSGDDLSGADLSGADISGADISGADLSGSDLSGVQMPQSTIYEISGTLEFIAEHIEGISGELIFLTEISNSHGLALLDLSGNRTSIAASLLLRDAEVKASMRPQLSFSMFKMIPTVAYNAWSILAPLAPEPPIDECCCSIHECLCTCCSDEEKAARAANAMANCEDEEHAEHKDDEECPPADPPTEPPAEENP